MVDVKHIYWLAGFIDGEGSFGWNETPCLTVTSTDEDLLTRCAKFIRAKTLIRKYLKPPNRPIYVLGLVGYQAIEWMMTLYPLLCARRQAKIREVIARWKLSPPANETKTHCPKGHPYKGRNLVVDLNGARRCRICKNATCRRSQNGRS